MNRPDVQRPAGSFFIHGQEHEPALVDSVRTVLSEGRGNFREDDQIFSALQEAQAFLHGGDGAAVMIYGHMGHGAENEGQDQRHYGRDNPVPEGSQPAVFVPPVILTDIGRGGLPAERGCIDPDMAAFPQGKAGGHLQRTDCPFMIADKDGRVSVKGDFPFRFQFWNKKPHQRHCDPVENSAHRFISFRKNSMSAAV